MKGVYVVFIIHPQHDQKAACQTKCKAHDINEGKYFVSPEIPESGFKIIFKHRSPPNLPEGEGFLMLLIFFSPQATLLEGFGEALFCP
jgi:hypothetical protein